MKTLKFTFRALACALGLYAAFTVFIWLQMPEYYGRHATTAFGKIWSPGKTEWMTSDAQSLVARSVPVQMTGEQFEKAFAGKTTYVSFDKEHNVVNHYGFSGTVVGVTSEAVRYSLDQAPGTAITSITVLKSGCVVGTLTPNDLVMDTMLTAALSVLAGCAAFGIGVVAISILGVVAIIGANIAGKKTSRKFEETFLFRA
ncbi:MAG TPA: hypothetical protein VFT82_01970 [Candidatus Paceibacterota bacterium]|nr:hypothetical protein [Candidatus Paceibacterota bacterium]